MGIPGEVPPAPQITENSTIVSNDEKTEHIQEQDEREEGEIVDEFEDIISSDEEVTLKKRIEELEERNLELEKIARISAVYNCDYNKERYDITNLPVSDISDNDDLYLSPTPAKAKHRSKKSLVDAKAHSGEKLHHRRLRRRELSPDSSLPSLHSRTKGKKKKNQKLSKSKSRKKTEKVKKKVYINDASSDEEFCALNRDKLRLALKRDVPAPCKPPNEVNIVNVQQDDDEVQVIEQVVEVVELESDKDEEVEAKCDKETTKNDSDDSATLEEQELRFIALKSAIMKKAVKRKKRKESEGRKPYSPSEFVELKGGFINSPRDSMDSGPMDISPIASPDLSDPELSNKPVDMELVRSNSSSPVLVGHSGNWIPINNIPLPSNDKQFTEVIHSPKAIKPGALSNTDRIPAQKQAVRENEYQDHTKLYIRSSSPDPSDEEELALRTLLLAKMKSPKVGKKPKISNSTTEQRREVEDNRPRSIDNNSTETGLDPEALKIVLELSMKESFNNKTELVLKEAVRRLKNQTTCESPDLQIGEDSHRISIHTNTSNSKPLTPVPMASEERGAIHPIVLNEEVKENMQQEILMNAVPVAEQRISVSDNVPEYTQNILENLKDVGRSGAVLQPTVPKRVERKDMFHVHSNQNSVAINRNVLKVVPVTMLGELQTPKSALVPIPLKPTIVDTSNNVKAINIPKMKTKVIRTRTKVVNKTNTPITQVKRKLSTKQTEVSSVRKKMKIDASPSERKDTTKLPSSRLITKLDIPKVNQMIIHLGQSESDSDDVSNELTTTAPANENDYFDNASPMSLPMDSPCYSPILKSPAPVGDPDANSTPNDDNDNISEIATAGNSTKQIINDVFEARLDEFLKNARSKVEQSKLVPPPNTPKSSEVSIVQSEESAKSTDSPATSTPLAVRHLPPSSQLEYRRLVNRMKLLEKQKQARSNKIMNKNLDQIKVAIKNKQTENQKELPETSSIIVATVPTVTLGPTKVVPQIIIQKTVLNDFAAIRNENSAKSSLIKKVLTKAVATKAGINKPPVTKPQNSEGKVTAVPVENEKNAASVKDINMNSEPSKTVAEPTIKPAINSIEAYETEFKENSSRLCDKISNAMELVKVASDERHKQLLLQRKLEEVKKEMLKLEGELDSQKKILSKILPEISEHHKNITELKAKCLKIEKSAKIAAKNVNIGGDVKFNGNSDNLMDKCKQFALAIKHLKNMSISELSKSQEMAMEDSNIQNTEGTKNCEALEIPENNVTGELNKGAENKNNEEQAVAALSEKVELLKGQVEKVPPATENISTELEEYEQRQVENSEKTSESNPIPESIGISEDISNIYSAEQQTKISCDIAMETNQEMHNCAIEESKEVVEKMNFTGSTGHQSDLSTKEEQTSVPESMINQISNETVNSDLCSLIASNASLILEKFSQGLFGLDNAEEEIKERHSTLDANGVMTEEVTEPKTDESTKSVQMEGIIRNESQIEDVSKEDPPSKFKEYASPLDHMNEESHFNPNGIICPFQLMGQCSDDHCKYEHLNSDNCQPIGID